MKKLKKYCLALDLIPDQELINEYIQYHQNVWPEILASIKESGIEQMEIYHIENRLFMIIEADDSFDFKQKEKLDKQNPTVQKWEQLMWKYQQAIPGGRAGAKWRLMHKIFDLELADG